MPQGLPVWILRDESWVPGLYRKWGQKLRNLPGAVGLFAAEGISRQLLTVARSQTATNQLFIYKTAVANVTPVN